MNTSLQTKVRTLVAFFAGAALAAGVAAYAGSNGMGAGHLGMMVAGSQSPEDIAKHVDHVLKHFYVEIDATDEQKAQIDPLVKQAVNDLLPLRAQAKAAHAQAVEALSGAQIDRNALESARATHLQLADTASKRLVQLIADVGDVLTPAQRTALAAHLKTLHERHGS